MKKDMVTTIDDKLRVAKAAYYAACNKHAAFAKTLTDCPGKVAARNLAMLKWWNDENCAKVTAEHILNEEVAEIVDAWTNATPEVAYREIFDAIAVLLRMADTVERRMK